jgi:3-hydroxyisobutyrate dehydrogenase-like beta-hydroxyacid dehydrogenase
MFRSQALAVEMNMTDVTIIGLGQMGFVLADLMLKAGRSVSVWNRNPEKAAALVARGGILAGTPAAAIRASPVTLICVSDYDAARDILRQEGVADALRGRLIANLGTGGPEEAREAESEIGRLGGRYLDGAIQAAPSQMGEARTPILISGPASVFAEAEPLLKILAGNLVYLGERIDAAAFMDLATLSYVYGAYAGFLHGARIAEATDISVEAFGRIVNDISPSFGAFFKHEGAVIQSGNFAVSESPMRISIAAAERILQTSESLRLNTELPALVNRWLQDANRAGLADEELAAMIKILRT